MSDTYPVIPLGEVLRLDLDKVPIDPSITYEMVGVYSFGRGLFHREPVHGGNTSYKFFYRLKADHVVMSQLFGWEGALATSSEEFAGSFVSPQFPTFLCDLQRLDQGFLGWLMRMPTFWEDLATRTKGMGDRRRTLNPGALFKCAIPLPPLTGQRRIVARIEALAAKIAEARGLRRLAAEETGALSVSAISNVMTHASHDERLADVLMAKPRNGWSARCDNVEGGIAVLSLGAVTGFTYRANQYKTTSEATDANAHYWLRPGDLLITRSNTPELVGHAAIYNGSPFPCIYPDLMMRIEVDEVRADAKFVHRWIQSNTVRDYIAGNAKGTSPTMKKISQGTVMDIPFPSHLPLPEQRRIVAYLDGIQAKAESVRRLQAETAAELDALLPAILHRAFRGEL